MERFARWAVSLVVPKGSRLDTDADRASVGKLGAWISIVLNVVLFILKGWLGLLAGSVALIAHAFDTLSDCVTSVILLMGFRMSEKPADDEHPFGHGRMESVVAIVVSVLLAVTALEILKMSVNRLLHPVSFHTRNWIIIVLASTIILKELAARFAFALGRIIRSEALAADARHHRGDGLSTVLVVATLIVVHWNLTWVDGAMGIVVAFTIGWTAYESLRDSVNPLLGQPASEEELREINRIAREVSGVLGVHDIGVHRYGAVNVISLHIEVCASENAMRLHDLSDQVEMRLDRRFHGHAVVHVDPLNTDHPHYEEARRIVADVIEKDPRIASFHDLRLLGSGERFKAVFDITSKNSSEKIDLKEVRRKVRDRLAERFPRVRVFIVLEPPYLRSVTDSGKVA